MRVTKQQLKQIIKEELEAVLGEGESLEQAGIKMVSQQISDKAARDQRLAKELAKLPKNPEKIRAMLSPGRVQLEQYVSPEFAKATAAQKAEFDRPEDPLLRYLQTSGTPEPEMDPRTKAEKAKEIIVGSGLPVAGAVTAGVLVGMAASAVGASLTPLALATWALSSLAGWAVGKGIDDDLAREKESNRYRPSFGR